MKKNEFGRSMVEILGVLAVIGVLSVAGVYGYSIAMRKHKTNEIMRELIFRANQVSTQLVLGTSVSEVDTMENAFLPTGQYSFTAVSCGTNRPCSDTDDKFIITMSGESGSTIPPDICRQLYMEMGTNTVIQAMGWANAFTSADDCGSADANSLTFVFNKDLSR